MHYLSIKLIMTLWWYHRSDLKNFTFSFYSSSNVLVFKSESDIGIQKILNIWIYLCLSVCDDCGGLGAGQALDVYLINIICLFCIFSMFNKNYFWFLLIYSQIYEVWVGIWMICDLIEIWKFKISFFPS